MSTLAQILAWFSFLDSPWVHFPIAIALFAVILWRLRAWLHNQLSKLRPPARKTTSWLQRNYLWIVVPLALLAYGILLALVTWELPFIADQTLEELKKAVGHDASSVRSYAYALTALMAGVALLATVPFQLIKTWINERQAQTAEQGHITDRLTKAIEQLGTEKTQKFRVRSYEYDLPAGDRRDRIEKNQRAGEDPDIPPDAENVQFSEWQTSDETVPNLEVRLGAIYALERIAQDSERDHITVMETLCAYVRENAPASEAKVHDLGDWPDYPEDATEDDRNVREGELIERQRKLREWSDALSSPRVDIQAALTVIGRRSDERIEFERRQERSFQLDLRNTNLRKADLTRAKLNHALLTHARMEGASLFEARMERANLREARMEGASLTRARMEGANLTRAQMERANLGGARMEGASLFEARMEGANLREARMEGASLIAAQMEGASLTRAQMERAYLSGARMEGAKLHSADLKSAALTETFADTSVRAADLRSDSVTQEILNNVFGDAATKIPDGLDRPDHWDDQTLQNWEKDPKFKDWLESRRKAKRVEQG